ncbi:hypothetical protein E2320_022339 [Naja naja]|nr:hypothetical protein E2320_022339 [Naja naja]
MVEMVELDPITSPSEQPAPVVEPASPLWYCPTAGSAPPLLLLSPSRGGDLQRQPSVSQPNQHHQDHHSQTDGAVLPGGHIARWCGDGDPRHDGDRPGDPAGAAASQDRNHSDHQRYRFWRRRSAT